MHHAHAGGHGVERRTEADRRAAQADLARVRRLQAEQDAHQGRLAGPVLAHHPVDFAALDRKVDAVVRDEPAIALDDADGFDLGHENAAASTSPSSGRRS